MQHKSTDDLFHTLNQIQTAEELENYLTELKRSKKSMNLSDYLNYIIHVKNLELKDVVSSSGLEPHYAYQIINGNKQKPSRIKVLALCIACHMTLSETQHALEISHNGILYPRDTADAIIIFHLNQENWSIASINDQLNSEGLPILE